MKCYYYWLFEPLGTSFEDNLSEPAKFEIKEIIDGYVHTVVVANSDSGRPYFIRVEITGITRKEIPQVSTAFLQKTKEHIVTLLRLTFDRDLKIFPNALWCFRSDLEGPNMRLGFTHGEAASKEAYRAVWCKQGHIRRAENVIGWGDRWNSISI